jgi:hypothetical protein
VLAARVKVSLINDTVYRFKVGAKRSSGTATRGGEMIHAEDLGLRHVLSAHTDIRVEDRMEWLAATGQDVWPRISTFGYGPNARVALDEDGKVMCFWGAEGASEEGIGDVWLVATRSAVPRAKAIHRHLRPELDRLHSFFPTLQCWADSRNKVHHEWLRWLGFKQMGERFYGVAGLPFMYFRKDSLRRDQCALQQ